MVCIEALVAILYYMLTEDRDLLNVDYDQEYNDYFAWRAKRSAYLRKQSSEQVITAADRAWMQASDGMDISDEAKFVAHQRSQRP